MNSLVITIHIIACIVLVILVLLQSGKEGMGVIFGGGSTSLFGSSGAGGLLTKLTGAAATVFFVTSLTFTYMSTSQHQTPRESIVLDAPVADQVPAPNVVDSAQNVASESKSAGQEDAESVEATPADAVQHTKTADDPAKK
ncbi:MAG: preprotein translocase subunit SecG [Deltaproteobacteria bacterium]|nr:MAG: preprotein translocase subunit SecG [Deltaproteobacteria bacterium]